MFYRFHGAIFAAALVAPLLAPCAQAQAPEDSPWRVEYIARLGWGNNIIPFPVQTAVDAGGNQYVAGTTQIRSLPTTEGVIQPEHAGGECTTASRCRDAFVAKLDSQGRLQWLTYLGGAAEDTPTALAVDQEGNIYIAGGHAYLPGVTFPANFPFTSLDLPPAESPSRGFLVKLAPGAVSILYAVPLPFSPTAMAIDESGAVYLTGPADAATPNTQPSLPRGNDDGHIGVAKVSPAADRLEYSLVLGGNSDDWALGIAVDASGQAHVCGVTRSSDFPITPGAFQSDYRAGTIGEEDAYALKLNADGTALLYSTYLGGSESDEARSCAIGPEGNLFVAGSTFGPDFPTTPGAFQEEYQGGESALTARTDGFVAKLDSSGSSLLYSTYLGGAGLDEAWSISVDAGGKAYVAGRTTSLNFPVVHAAQASIRGDGDAFLSVLNEAGSDAEFSTYLGGNHGAHGGMSVAAGSAGEFVAVGHAAPYFPATPGALDWEGTGFFAAKFTPEPSDGPLVYIDGIVNAANFLPVAQVLGEEDIRGAVAAGQLVTLYGHGIGPATPAGLELDANGRVSTETAGTRVLFDGIPAPLLYVSATQVNAVAPWSIAGKITVQVEVERNGQRSAPIELHVVEASPAFFTHNPNGQGQAAALNQDGTLNSRDNPAALGSVIVLYATGLGLFDQALEDGEVISTEPPFAGLRQPVTVLIGSLEAEVLYAGPAPGYVAGLVQINARIPTGIFHTDGAGVSVRVGDYASFEFTGIAIPLTSGEGQ